MALHDNFGNTMIGNVGAFKPHRIASISLVENGFKVDASFIRTVTRRGHGESPYEEDTWVDREFVFYTVDEALSFLKEYMTADKESLRT